MSTPEMRRETRPNHASTSLATRFADIRARTRWLAGSLSAEDAMLQSMPDASPTKWHLGHTSWFFEQFVLAALNTYSSFDSRYSFIFNSYYQSVGAMHARPHRGALSRPPLDEVLRYREHVDNALLLAIEREQLSDSALLTVELGIQHEQQHQELLLTDIQHALFLHPWQPAWREDLQAPARVEPSDGLTATQWIKGETGLHSIGAEVWPQSAEFAFDSESPRHQTFIHPHALANRLVNCADYREFIRDGGYQNPALWLSAGFELARSEGWTRPPYWDEQLERTFSLAGMREIDPSAPVAHLSYFEADAFARWAGARLPNEAEWEIAAVPLGVDGNFACRGLFQPQSSNRATAERQQFFGDVWEWTASDYSAYPGFVSLDGALGEYNGKFMCGQYVLRGGSCATPQSHMRASYRNFFPPHARWQFSGVRLAKDC